MSSVVRAIGQRAQLPGDVDIEKFNYVDTGHVDSLEMIRFVLEIETEFGVEITAADMESAGFRTIGGLVSIIDAKLKGIGGADG